MKQGQNYEKMQEEGMKLVKERQKHGEMCLDKWSNNEIGVGLAKLYAEDAVKARNTAILLENEERHLEQLSESIVSQNFQTTPENVLKIVRIGSANSCRGEIFTEVPLSTVDDAIYFIDMIYESTKRDATANDLIYENAYKYYASEQYYKDTVGSVTTQFSITLDTLPVIPNKVMILLDGALVGSDLGSSGTVGTITPIVAASGANLTTSPTSTYQEVTYATGVVKLEFDANLAATNTIKIIYHFDTEQSSLHSQLGTVSLTLTKKRFECRPMPLGYNFTQMLEVTLGTTTGVDAEEILVGAIGDEHAKTKDYFALVLARAIANKNETYTFNAAFAAVGELSLKSRAQQILTKIENIGGVLYDDIKRGKINKAIVGTNMLSFMKLHDKWVVDNSMVRTGVYKAGRLDDIDVYCCPADDAMVTTNDALLTYKNPLEGLDIGIAFGVLTELTAKLTYPQMYTEGYIATVGDELVINNKFIRKLTLENFSI